MQIFCNTEMLFTTSLYWTWLLILRKSLLTCFKLPAWRFYSLCWDKHNLNNFSSETVTEQHTHTHTHTHTRRIECALRISFIFIPLLSTLLLRFTTTGSLLVVCNSRRWETCSVCVCVCVCVCVKPNQTFHSFIIFIITDLCVCVCVCVCVCLG